MRLIDNLTLTYNGNQLKSVEDKSSGADPIYNGAFNFEDGTSQSQEYFYDANGNLIKDLNKKITSVEYNTLNLPSRINLQANRYADYQYSADGVKRHKESYTRIELVIDPVSGSQGFEKPDISLKTQQLVKPGLTHKEVQIGRTYTDYCGNCIYEDGQLSKI